MDAGSKFRNRMLQCGEYYNVRDELTVTDDNILLRGKNVVIPASLINQVVALAHEGHQAIVKTKERLRLKSWFPQMNDIAESAVRRCFACQCTQNSKPHLEPMQITDMPGGAWRNLSMDFLGPLPSGEELMVLVDEYSRFPIVEIIRSVSANTVIPVLDKHLATFGYPDVIKSDNGAPCNYDAFASFAKHSGFRHRRVTECWPRGNAQAEGFNKPLRQSDRRKWSREIGSKRCTNFCDSTEQRHTLLPSSVHTDCCSAENLAPNYHVSQHKTTMTTEQVMLQHEKTTNRQNSAKRRTPSKGTRLSTTICTWEILSSCVTTSGLISCPVHSVTNQCLSLIYAVPPSQQLTTITRSGEILLVSRRYSIHYGLGGGEIDVSTGALVSSTPSSVVHTPDKSFCDSESDAVVPPPVVTTTPREMPVQQRLQRSRCVPRRLDD